jgi:type II secretory pathway component GspD/PulD (secretin)
MQANRKLPVCRRHPLAHAALALTLVLVPVALSAHAQTSTPTSTQPCTRAHDEEPTSTQTFFLKNVSQQNDANEILIALRNMLCPNIRVYLIADQNAIVINASADELQLAQKLIAELDRPHTLYRLTYSLNTIDHGKRIATQRYTVVVAAGQRVTLKQGLKVPIVTGTYDRDSATALQQVQYLDIGMSFDSTVNTAAEGVVLKSKIEQSSVAEEKSGVGPQDPAIRQTVLEGTSSLTLGKPLVLGSLDAPGANQRVEIEVTAEALP